MVSRDLSVVSGQVRLDAARSQKEKSKEPANEGAASAAEVKSGKHLCSRIKKARRVLLKNHDRLS